MWILSLFHHDATRWAPGWVPWVFLYKAGFFHAICALLWDMAVEQGAEQSWLLYSSSKYAGSFHSEQTSGQTATRANRHGINSTDNKHVTLHPVMDKPFIFSIVSDTIAVNYMRDTVRRRPVQTMQTNYLQDFFQYSLSHHFSLLNHIVDCMYASIWLHQLKLRTDDFKLLHLHITYIKILWIKLKRKAFPLGCHFFLKNNKRIQYYFILRS